MATSTAVMDSLSNTVDTKVTGGMATALVGSISGAVWRRFAGSEEQETTKSDHKNEETSITSDVKETSSCNDTIQSNASEDQDFTADLQSLDKQETESTLPPVAEWPYRPLYLRANHGSAPAPCPLGVPFAFESDLFIGTALIRIKDVPSEDPEADAAYFEASSNRRYRALIQGRFKQELNVADVMTGHEFAKPLQNLPPRWIMDAGVAVIKRLSPGAILDFYAEQPKMLSILAATAQTLTTTPAPCEQEDAEEVPQQKPPSMLQVDMEEDGSALGGVFAEGTQPHSCKEEVTNESQTEENEDKNENEENTEETADMDQYTPKITSAQRKRMLADPETAAKYTFDTQTIYTFDFYQDLLDVADYTLDFGWKKVSVAESLNGQPVQVLAKTTAVGCLWNFEIWHENQV